MIAYKLTLLLSLMIISPRDSSLVIILFSEASGLVLFLLPLPKELKYETDIVGVDCTLFIVLGFSLPMYCLVCALLRLNDS